MSRVFALIAITLFAVVCVSAQTSNDPCSQAGAVPAAQFTSLIAHLNAIPNTFNRLDYLANFTENTSYGFSASQAVTLAQAFKPNSIIMRDVYLNNARMFLGMKCSDVVNILNSITNDLLKLDILPAVANLTTDLNQNKSVIVNSCFTNIFNKQHAQAILDAAQPLSCVWGPITAKQLLFVVDVSTSMGTNFKDPTTGLTTTRLAYVKSDLTRVISNVLQPYQSFNIMYFSDSYKLWSSTIQPVNAANIASALTFVNGLTAYGSTNTLGALKAAFVDPKVQAVYLLSDGQPNSGQAPQAITAAKAWSQASTTHDFLNTVCFQVGGTYDPTAASFMLSLAQATGGVYRNIN